MRFVCLLSIVGLSAGLADFDPAAIAKRVLPAVVMIRSKVGATEVSGSGFVVDPSGTIVTNLHVIRGATSVAVKTHNGDIYDQIKVRSFDERKDLAVIQVAGFGLPTIEFADSESIQPGQRVVLIGNALGVLEGSVSTGVVSGIRNMEGYKVIQTDATANHGNSGGPLLNEDGRAIGVVTFKVGEGVAENLNFAVPVNYARGMVGAKDAIDLNELATRLGKTTDLFAKDGATVPRRWKSLTSGTVRTLRIDGDYLYEETEKSAEAKQRGDFQVGELKKIGDRYVGTGRSAFTCSYTKGLGIYARVLTNRCVFDDPVEITLFTPTRIEGRAPEADPGTKFKCWECKYDPARSVRPFTWIPE